VETGRRPLAHLCRYLLATLYTGSRPGAWLDATWDRGPGRAWVDVEGGRFYRQPEGTIANDKRKPPVTLTPLLRRLLAGWKRADGGRGHVVTFNGKPILSVKTGLATACRLAGLDARVTAYTLRHTAASWLIAKGLPTKKVAEFLGTSEAMIDAHYGHLAPDYQQAAAMAIGRK
jgi:integrase